MTVEVSKVYLLDVATGDGVEAELRDAIEQVQIDDWAKHWIPAILAAIQDLVARQVPRADWPQSLHWNWPKKIARVQGMLAFPGFSVVAQGKASIPRAESLPRAGPEGQASRLRRVSRGRALEPL